MNISVVTPADTLPVSIASAHRHLRTLADDSDMVNLYCRAATAAVEDYTGRIFVTTVFKATLDTWPNFGLDNAVNTKERLRTAVWAIELPRSPLLAIDFVKYYPEGGGAQVTWSASNYRTDLVNLPGRLVLVDDVDLPSLEVRADAVEIQFQAGCGLLESQMPPLLVLAMLELARHFFDNPSAVDTEGKARRMPLSYQHLLRSQRVAL